MQVISYLQDREEGGGGKIAVRQLGNGEESMKQSESGPGLHRCPAHRFLQDPFSPVPSFLPPLILLPYPPP